MPRLGTIDSSGHQARFLECFVASGGRILTAARWAKLHRNSHYNWIKEDPTYKARFQDAEARAARTLQDEAIRRAHEGVRRAVRYKGKVVCYEREYSDTLMLALLKAKIPDEFSERKDVRLASSDGGPLVLKLVPSPGPKVTVHVSEGATFKPDTNVSGND